MYGHHAASVPAAQRHTGQFTFGNSNYYLISPLHGRLNPAKQALHRQKIHVLHGHSTPLPKAATRDVWHGKARG